ncbi:LysR family transcriptional regulator [Bradyrhizobium sp.]|uniref:LysR family transcriptional regulator n=1 Tax=Bradyrhizobium sp. TaxID=376 RepID=UPI0025BFE622|nr:LysR family transcriptional regulator [Bradyrhizobium sp.]
MRRSLNLNRLVVFAAVVEAGSLTGAAKRLRLTKTVVSSHLKKLEEELGVTLIGRTTRRMRLTDIGRELHERTQGPLIELMAGAAAARDHARAPRGSVRVTAPIDYGSEILAPLLVRIQQENPGLVIDLILDDHPLDFIAEGIDIAIRIGWVLQDSSYRTVRLGAFKTWVVAPASWASSAPSIRTPTDLLGRPFIAGSMLKSPARWEFGSADGIHTAQIFDITMFANTNVAVRAAVESGGGFTILPDFAVRSRLESGSLIRLLDNWSLPSGDIQAIMPAARHQSAVARMLFSSLQTLLRQAAN